MSVINQTPVNSFVGNALTTVFNFTFQLLDSSDLRVTVDDEEQIVGSHYTVSGVGNPAGGSVTFISAPASSAAVVVWRESVLERETDYQNNGDLRASIVNLDFDRIWLALQDVLYRYQLSPTMLPGSPLAGNVSLPSPGAGKFLRWNLDGTNLEAVEGTGTAPGEFVQSGLGAVARTMQDKAGEIISRADFSTEAQYKTAFSGMSGGGFWADQTPAGNVWRFVDRIFVGEAATKANGDKLQGADAGTWLTSANGAFWIERGATTLSVSTGGEFGIVGASRCSDKSKSGYYGTASIGVVGVVENDDSGHSLIGWAGYFEANRGAGNGTVFCQEISVKNKGNNQTSTPYNRGVWGSVGLWMPAGGDASYNGVNANPCNTAILIGRGDDAGNTALPMTWNKGIVFHKDGITGTDGVTGTGIAIQLAKGHIVGWESAVGPSAYLYSEGNTLNQDMRLVFSNNVARVSGNGDAKIIQFLQNGATSANNDYWDLYNSPSAGANGAVQLRTSGVSTNIDMHFIPKGAGVLRFGSWTSNADTAVTGYITIKDASGVTRKLATIA